VGFVSVTVFGLSLPVENQIVKQLIVWQGAANRRAVWPRTKPDENDIA
jgi:hypothetical protein